MIEKKVEICIGTDRSKHVRARLSLLVVEDGNVLSEHYHSVAIPPGADLAFIRAAVEQHIAAPEGGVPGAPWPAIPDAEWAEVEGCCGVIHPPARVAKYREDRAQEAAAEAAIFAAAKATQDRINAEQAAREKKEKDKP